MAKVKVFKSCEECPIIFLAKRNPESEDETWTQLFALGRDWCQNQAGDKARKIFDEALNLAEDLASVKDKRVNHIKATIWTCIGTLSLCGQIQPGAIENLRRGEGQFSLDGDKYSHGVALYALGVYYSTQQEWREVRRFYERSLSVLANAGNGEDTSELREQVKIRNRSARDKWMEKEVGKMPNFAPPSSSKSNRQFATLEFLPVFGQIPAGDPRPIPDRITGYVETDHIMINDKPHKVIGSDGTKLRLNFSPEVSYIVLPIHGDSMNNAGIDDGDYVILRVRASGLPLQPETGDVVAAALSDEPEVTLKRFRREEKKIILEPVSLNPEHKERSFEVRTEFSIPFRIVGVYVATLKLL
ncbi:MAG: hypothetical protein HZB51_19335 [Chloroflexi bacterium]|nr:hypothetical protein [Chloroflexota bacterium]